MGRILAIDYGRKRTGVAATDSLQIVANGIGTIPTHQLLTWLEQYLADEIVDRVIIGLPIQLSGAPSENYNRVLSFIGQFRKKFPSIPIEQVDERFTSTLAHQAMIQGGMKRKDRQDKAKVDTIAAAIILNDYLQSKHNTI